MNRFHPRGPAGRTRNQMPVEVQQRLLAQAEEANQYVRVKLSEAGVDVDGIDVIVNSRQSFPEAIPVLVKLIDDPALKDESIFCGVVAALRDPAAVGVAYQPLVRLLRMYAVAYAKDRPGLVDDIASTVGYVATDENAEELIEMIRDMDTFGRSRLGLVDGLSRYRNHEKLVTECRWMIRDPQILWTTLELIGGRKLVELVEEVRETSQDPSLRSEFRTMAKRQLAKLEKEIQKAERQGS